MQKDFLLTPWNISSFSLHILFIYKLIEILSLSFSNPFKPKNDFNHYIPKNDYEICTKEQFTGKKKLQYFYN